MTTSQSVAFLDRDGTLVESSAVDGVPVPNHGAVEFTEGASRACERLKQLGFSLVMVTNQPDVARGVIDQRTVEFDNQRVAEYLGLDLVLACMHDDLDRCACRKPRAGLLHQAASMLGLDLDRSSVMIGDRWRDIGAGRAAGVTTVLIDRGYGENLTIQPDYIATNLITATDWIAEHLGRDRNEHSQHFSP